MENNFLSGVSTSKNNNIKQNAFLDDSLDNSIDDNDASLCDVPEKNSNSSKNDPDIDELLKDIDKKIVKNKEGTHSPLNINFELILHNKNSFQ